MSVYYSSSSAPSSPPSGMSVYLSLKDLHKDAMQDLINSSNS
jgi:hypothetical protein